MFCLPAIFDYESEYMRLILALLFAFATPLAAQDMTDEERAIFRAEVRAYLLANPEVIMEAVAVLEQRENEAKNASDLHLARANADALHNDPTSFETGNPEGDITIVEFLDYRCGYCKRAFPEIEALLESDSNIRLIIKELPILGEQSVLASRFALAVKQTAGDEMYQTVHDALMEFRGEITQDSLGRLAQTLFLDLDTIIPVMNNTEVNAIIAQNRALSQRLQSTGPPTWGCRGFAGGG
jgi:protein-disulfide isomerase